MYKRFNISYTKLLAFGFLIVILLGTLLLCLPISSRNGEWTPFSDACFTATSSTCVTGLVVYDTYTHWSVFGQIVILTLIQIGGLGFMTVISMFTIFMRRRISLSERRLLMQSSGNMRLDGVLSLIRRIITGTLIFEAIGAVILSIRFCERMSVGEAIYNGIFHSVSAFCNAGFDLMGKYGRFSSFTEFRNDNVVCFTLMVLIVIGGIGFPVWSDILHERHHVKRYSLHTKVVLTVTVSLILFGAVAFYFLEYDHSLAGLTTSQKITAALFQSVTLRTAGFNTIDQSALSSSGNIISCVLMLIGGSPNSTAGGIKTTTVLVAVLTALNAAKNTNDVTVFKRRIEGKLAKQAFAIVTVYLMLVIVSSCIICAVEPYGASSIVFEVSSAAGTVGLSHGITPTLSSVSHIILVLLMYLGRIGGLSMVLIITEGKKYAPVERPIEKILIG